MNATSSLSRRTLLRGSAALGLGLVPLVSVPEAAFAQGVDPRLAVLWSAHRGALGVPLAPARNITGGLSQEFRRGTMYYTTKGGPAVIMGKLRETFLAGGGTKAMGFPLLIETKSPDYANCYTQWTLNAGSQVWWSSSHGGYAIPGSRTIHLPGADNFRDAAGEDAGVVAGTKRMRRRLVFRCPQIGGLPSFSRFVLQTLWIDTIISLGGTDVTVPGIRTVPARMRNLAARTDEEKEAMYRNYVTSGENRASVGVALAEIAAAKDPVMYHCAAGNDRTGWLTAMIHLTLGVSSKTVFAEYLKSNDHNGSLTSVKARYLQAGLDQAKASYGSVRNYLAVGCGVPSTTLTALKNRLLV